MKRTAATMAMGLVLVGAACASAQTPGTRSLRTLAAMPEPEAAQTRELRIQWVTAPAPAGQSAQPAPTLTILRQTVAPGRVRRERAPELSPNHLVVVVENAAGRALDWRVVTDPRIIRAETPGPDGKLTGHIVEPGSVELLLAINDVAGTDGIQIYKPIWNGKDYTLEPLARLRISAGQ